MNKLAEIMSNPVLLDVQAGLTQAKNEIMSIVKFGVNFIIIPIACAILAGVAIFLICQCVGAHKRGEDYKDKIMPIVILVIVFALLASAPTWIWTMAGV